MSQPNRIPDRFATADPRSKSRRLTKNALLNRPDRRKDSGTAATNFRGRAKARRVRLRKLQRQARRRQP
jgi:hypothetical protein